MTVIACLTACNTSDRQSDWNDWTDLKQRHADRKSRFDSLTIWLIGSHSTNTRGFMRVDKLPADKKSLLNSLDVQTILLENYFCEMTDTRGGMRITYEFNKKPTDKAYSYLMYARCITTDLENNIEWHLH